MSPAQIWGNVRSRYTRAMRVFPLLAALVLTTTAQGQWKMQDSHTTADLRGIDSLGGGVAWASGTNGTVLRTEDAGVVWQLCTVPTGADKLDFRGVQASDNMTAIVMSSGPEDQSRLYKTTDGCKTWKILFTNPNHKDGFWDALRMNRHTSAGWLLGDPVDGSFTLFTTKDKGATWTRDKSASLAALAGEGGFAASNSSLQVDSHGHVIFGTGGAKVARIYTSGAVEGEYVQVDTPFAAAASGAGIFSIASRSFVTQHGIRGTQLVAVGGDYTKPNDRRGTAASSADDGASWVTASVPPTGYRSSVAYDALYKVWISVGPNGTDVSTDDGGHWRALKPGLGDAADADQHWNALSLPYVVGPHGRLATLRSNVLDKKQTNGSKE